MPALTLSADAPPQSAPERPEPPERPARSDRSAQRPQRRQRHRRRRTPTGLFTRALIGLLGLVLLALALLLAWQHPLGAVPAVASVLALTVLARYFWTVWPGWLLGLIPWVGLAPWTGWLVFEEFDLLVLASLAGGYLAMSGPHRQPPPPPVPVWRRELRWRRLTIVLLILAGLSASLAMVHGLVDGGGLRLEPWQGYMESGAALRQTKAFVWLLLMLPLWQRVSRRTPQTLAPSLMAGTATALLGVCVGALWERWQFSHTGLEPSGLWLSGFFWEMHVGGAALEGALALLMPFGLLLCLRRRAASGFAAAVALVLVALYVALCTGSQPLFLALGLTLPLVFTLWAQQEKRRLRGERDPASSWLPGQVLGEPVPPALPPSRALLVVGLLLLFVAWAASMLWPMGGWRGVAVLVGAVVALLAQPVAYARNHRGRALSFGLGAVLVAVPLLGLGLLLSMAVPRAAYGCALAYWLLSLLLGRLAASQRRPWFSGLGDALRAGCWLATVGGIGLVLWSWGGPNALEPLLVPLVLTAALWPLSQGGWYGSQLQQLGWRTRVVAMGAAGLLAAIVGLLVSATHWQPAAASKEGLLAERADHWRKALSALESDTNWVIGVGAGRFPWIFNAGLAPDERVGQYRWVPGSKPSLRLAASHHPGEPDQMLRMTQRIAAAPAGLQLVIKSRNDDDVLLHAEVCNKLRLSRGPCVTQRVTLRTNPDGWREHRISLGGQGELGDRPLQFAIGLAGGRNVAFLTDVSLKGADGVELLKNGGFQDGLTHWLMVQERVHQHHHARHIGLQLLFDQGVIGLILGLGLWLLALGRLLIGTARDHPLAPALTASLLGFVVMGQFESLIDVPRLALLFLVCLLLGLGLRAPPPPPIPGAARPRTRR